MKSLLSYRLDEIDNSSALSSVDKLVKKDFPTHQFDNASFLTKEEKIYVIKTLVKSLQVWVSTSELWDIKKYVFNHYSRNNFLNDDFYDLVASVFDYLEQVTKKVIDSSTIKNSTLLLKAVNATINAATVFIVRTNPLINKVLTDSQKNHVKDITNSTVKEVNMLESNKTDSDNKGNKMNQMFKTLMMSKMMSGNSGSVDPLLLSTMMANKSENNNSNMMQNFMLMQYMMKKKDGEDTETKGSGFNPAMIMSIMAMNKNKESSNSNSNHMLNTLLQQRMGTNNMGNNSEAFKLMMMMNAMKGGGNNNAYADMFSSMGNGFGSLLNNPSPQAFNPLVAHLYNDPELTSERTGRDYYSEMLQKQMERDQQNELKARAEAQMKNFMEMFNQNNSDQEELDELDESEFDPEQVDHDTGFIDDNEDLPRFPDPNEDNSQLASRKDQGIPYELYDSDADDVDIQIDCVNTRIDENDPYKGNPYDPYVDEDGYESVMSWALEDDEDDADDMVIYPDDYEEEHPHVFEMLRTDVEGNVGIETVNITKEQRNKEISIRLQQEDQQRMLDKFFGGKVPEGVELIHIDELPHYAFTPEALFSGSYTLADTLNYYFDQGNVPPADVIALPLTVKGETTVFSILNSDGVRIDMVIPVTGDEKVKIEDHIPAKAMVKWHKLQEQTIHNDDGTVIDDRVVIMENELSGTTNTASIVANCYAIATECIDINNSEFKPVEYTLNDPVGFYVEDAKAIVEKFGVSKEINDISKFIKSVNEETDLHDGIKAYIDEKGTAVINDFLMYSMVLNVKIDSFLEDYEALEKHISDNYSENVTEYLRKSQLQLTKAICNAVSGDDVENVETISLEFEEPETADGEEIKKTVFVEGESFNDNLVVFNNRVQVTELPWSLNELGLDFVKQLDKADPFVMLTKDSENPDIYEAIEELAIRATLDGIHRSIMLITKDRVKLSIIQSAYDSDTFMIVKRKK